MDCQGIEDDDISKYDFYYEDLENSDERNKSRMLDFEQGSFL